MARASIGTSGWNYRHWADGVFYPTGLKSGSWLAYFVKHFQTVEINNTFYRLPTETAFENWRRQAPQDFTFSVKASRFLTHIKRLKEPEEPLNLFLSRSMVLKNHLGPVLFQLPPKFNLNLPRLEQFLLSIDRQSANGNFRSVFEFRDPSWLVPEVFELLRAHNCALCLADWRDMPIAGPLTAHFVYVRRHYGNGVGGNYTKTALRRDAAQIRGWLQQGLDVYFYFNNDREGFAIQNALFLQEELGDATVVRSPRARS